MVQKNRGQIVCTSEVGVQTLVCLPNELKLELQPPISHPRFQFVAGAPSACNFALIPGRRA